MKRKFYFALICLLAGAAALMPSPVGRKLKAAVEDTLAPFTMFLRGSAGAVFRGERLDGADADFLAVELELARYEISRLKALEEENRKLREMLGLVEDSSLDLIPARVVGRDISGWWRKVQLDKGVSSGIERDMPVVSSRGVVGRVVSVSSWRSDVLLMVDPSCRVSARIGGSGAFGIVRGYGMFSGADALCRMEFIERGARVVPGDEVVTSGLGGIFPPGIKIGRVKSIQVDASGLYRNADILPASDFRWLDVVFVASSGEDVKEE